MFIYRGNKGESRHALVQYTVRLEEWEAAVLEEMRKDGGFANAICLIKSMLREIIADEVASDRKLKNLTNRLKQAHTLHP